MAKGMYVPLDVNYLRDPKIRKAGPDAELLFIRGLTYAKAGKTDGQIPEFDLSVVAVGLPKVSQRVDALVENGLWSVTSDGWRITGWRKWNKTNKELADDTEAKRKGAEKTNHTRYHTGPDADFNPSCSLCRDAEAIGGDAA